MAQRHHIQLTIQLLLEVGVYQGVRENQQQTPMQLYKDSLTQTSNASVLQGTLMVFWFSLQQMPKIKFCALNLQIHSKIIFKVTQV